MCHVSGPANPPTRREVIAGLAAAATVLGARTLGATPVSVAAPGRPYLDTALGAERWLRRHAITGGDTVGATLKAGSSNTDVTLLQLASAPTTADGVATYLGYLTTAVANTNNLALYRISHPAGSPQAYTEGVVDTTKGTCRTLPRGNFIYSRDTVGATEGGSSGSPVVNGSGQIVGQLYGACGTNVNNSCDAAANATVDGAFAASYPLLAPFLNPGSGHCGRRARPALPPAMLLANCGGKAGAKTGK